MKLIPFFSRLQKRSRSEARNEIIVISVLPRSGTSMMMKILESGGQDILTDHRRAPNEDNPQGYYEFERVKALRTGDIAWLPAASGKAVKIISALLEYLPSDYDYKIIFMRRDLDEILMSQRQMLLRSGENADKISDVQMKALFEEHLATVETWLQGQPRMQTLYVCYNDLLRDPEPHLYHVQSFIGKPLNLLAMKQVIDPGLYRRRSR